VTAIVNPNKKIRAFKKKLSFSDTFQNKINLADAYLDIKDLTNAILYYEKALFGEFENHPQTLNKAIKCYFEIKKYDKVVTYARKINLEKSFRDSLCIYAIALEKCEYFEEAEIQFKKTDKRYSNYPERLELSEFLIRIDKIADAKKVLSEIISEIENMIEASKKTQIHLQTSKQASKLLNTN
jgi:hypothetical protein